MARALALARRGQATTTPNPRVGCVLVRDGLPVGEGWHERAGEAHAEVHALRAAGQRARGSTAYVTLEPCSHVGRTGPCCEALVAAGVARVVAAMQDPNPLVSGQGFARLRAAGVAVRVGVAEAAARALNPGFIARLTRGWPWVRLKVAMSLDGRTALANGASQWITSAAARADGHRLRAEACAVLSGSGTILADDPQLTARDVQATRQPLRVVIDGGLRMPAAARVLDGEPTLVLARSGVLAQDAPGAGAERARALMARGARVIGVAEDPHDPAHLDLRAALLALGREPLNEVLVEGGEILNGALLTAGLVDECVFYVAPALLGSAARGPARLGPFERLAQRHRLRFAAVERVGPDLRITAVPEPAGATTD
ncbi:MAG: bifunctional diaminohydroxyphosphoribosylaminopyrimidine deaminase/5-amino-6-(5-phosphoribosylamino)uracil reductase RibD [Pseudomonadota bacterium]|nr:bifunctional diaminohydroxyphosphoribosylaminopyrimidine deaminase/5-amino-6-(5-phosphoribosylamino)uracil reductase RibD [Pseudomonadota bacterium]